MATKKVIRSLKRLRLTTSELATEILADGILQDGGLAIDAVPEKFKTTQTLIWRRRGIQFSKAAATAIAFSAAHPVTASKFGIITFEVDDAGTIASKIPGATQTTTQAYATAAAALAAKPAVTDGKTYIGHVIIEADAGGWTATTDDMTAASDLVTATFVDAPESALPSAL